MEDTGLHCHARFMGIVTRRLVESVGGVFDPVVSSAIFEHVKDKLAVIHCLPLATL